MIKVWRKIPYGWKVFFLLGVITVFTCFPYALHGLGGYEPDMMYHLQRIEGVRYALMSHTWPAPVYCNFYKGYGYASGVFYPDIFLIFPALLRILGLSPLKTWKVFMAFCVFVGSGTTYWSMHYVSRSRKAADICTMLLMLSQYYIGNLTLRVGLSETIAYIFMPILFAGIYDYFARDGKKTWLIGLGMGGTLLSHTLMTLIGFIVTVCIFIFMLLRKDGRKAIFNRAKFPRLLVTCVVTALVCAYYLFPLLEQMLSEVTFEFTVPSFRVGDYIQPFWTLFIVRGWYNVLAYVGVGVPIFAAMISVFFRRYRNQWAYGFFFGGVFLLLAMTDLFVPWQYLEKTPLDIMQFPFRLYPYALCLVLFGVALMLPEAFPRWQDCYGMVAINVGGRDNTNTAGESEKREQTPAEDLSLSGQRSGPARIWTKGWNRFGMFYLGILICLALFFGFWQNYRSIVPQYLVDVTDERLLTDTEEVAAGEWLPVTFNFHDADCADQQNVVAADGSEIAFTRLQNRVGGTFTIKGSGEPDGQEIYTVPLLYYKGYAATLTNASDNVFSLEIGPDERGVMKVTNQTGQSGEIRVWYKGTTVQHISNAVSMITVLGLLIFGIFGRFRKARTK